MMQPHGVQSFAPQIWRRRFGRPLSAPGQRNSTAAFLTVCPMPQRSGIETRAQARTTSTQLDGAGFAALLSLFNIGGRIGWASLSDYIGRKRTYFIFFALGILLYSSAPFAGRTARLHRKPMTSKPASTYIVTL